MRDVPEFNIGDTVQIVSEPYMKCPFFWASGMNQYCGVITKIIRKTYHSAKQQFGYVLDGCRNYTWCGNCFEPLDSTPDFDITDEEFADLLIV